MAKLSGFLLCLLLLPLILQILLPICLGAIYGVRKAVVALFQAAQEQLPIKPLQFEPLIK